MPLLPEDEPAPLDVDVIDEKSNGVDAVCVSPVARCEEEDPDDVSDFSVSKIDTAAPIAISMENSPHLPRDARPQFPHADRRASPVPEPKPL